MGEPSKMDRAKQVVLALIAECGGHWEGKARLFKGFYFAHLYYMKETGLPLTGWHVVHMPNGPGIDRAEEVLGELEEDGRLTLHAAETDAPYQSSTYRVDPGLDHGLAGAQLEAVKRAVRHVSGKSGKELSDETHEQSAAWNATEPGEVMELVEDLLSDRERLAGKRAFDSSTSDVPQIFGG